MLFATVDRAARMLFKLEFLISVVAFGDKRLFHLSFDPRRRPKIDST